MPHATPPVDRVLARIVVSDDGCWLYTGMRNRGGYGVVIERKAPRLAHRVTYLTLVGDVPEGLILDHLCRVRHCVNPDHLEPVTIAENVRRGVLARTECRAGHPLDLGTDSRACLICRQAKQRKAEEARAARMAADPEYAAARRRGINERRRGNRAANTAAEAERRRSRMASDPEYAEAMRKRWRESAARRRTPGPSPLGSSPQPESQNAISRTGIEDR
jgi:hypothetical protein